MAFIKVVKTKAYYKRFQTRFRRRREGKTDYYARKRLIIQDKNKYNTPKYRLVVRITNQNVIAQVLYPTISGDVVYVRADSSELKKFGLTAGLTNYAASYATGLLVAKRLLKKAGLDKIYTGAAKIDGEDYNVANDAKERKPFKAVLDVGLVRTTTGNRVFGALKGACDGGLHVPHSTKRFPGYKVNEKGDSYNAKVHRERIFGVHVDKHMKLLQKKSPEAFKLQFSRWDATLKAAKLDSVEKLYSKIHEDIKKNPDFIKKERKQAKAVYQDKRKTIVVSGRKDKAGKDIIYKVDRKLTHQEKADKVTKKIQKSIEKIKKGK